MNLQDLKNSDLLTAIYVNSNHLKQKELLEQTLYSISKQTYLTDLLVLHPKFSASELKTLKKSLENPTIKGIKKDEKGQPVLDEKGNHIEEDIKSDIKINYILFETKSDNFSKIFNEAFNIALENKYDMLSIIEPEDVVGFNWFKTAFVYLKENDDVSIFFPIVRNTSNGVFAGYMNEASWAEGLSEEAGKFDMNLLNKFNCAVPLGAIYRIDRVRDDSECKDDGKYYPFKESIKLSHSYEFFLRMIYNDLKSMTIPRVGYELKSYMRDYFEETSAKIPQNVAAIPVEKGGVTPEEGKFWMELAKKEYFYEEDRNKQYEPTEQK